MENTQCTHLHKDAPTNAVCEDCINKITPEERLDKMILWEEQRAIDDEEE